MNESSNYRVDAVLDKMWAAWIDMFPMIPYWDPYGAMSAVILGIIAFGFLVRKVARG